MDVISFNELITLHIILCLSLLVFPHWTVHKHLFTLHASLKVGLIIRHDIADDIDYFAEGSINQTIYQAGNLDDKTIFFPKF